VTEPLEGIGAALAQRYAELGAGAHRELQRWLSGDLPFAFPEVLERHLQQENLALLFDAFWQVLPFGTGGRRGRVGYGANRLNPTTVALTIQGHCDFLRGRFPGRGDLAVVVANDVRVFRDLAGSYRFLGPSHPLIGLSSRGLARLACEIYAGNGIAAYLSQPQDEAATLSTPELSFAIGALKAAGGVNLSASHNHPDDNGVKVYDEFGSQPVAPADQQLLDIMAAVTSVKSRPFADALATGLVRPLPASLHEAYVSDHLQLYGDFFPPRPDLPVVYTPLCGVGLSSAGDVLGRLGFPVLTPPDERPDGAFTVIPFRSPNPEVVQSTQPARAFADQHGSGIVLSSDPDADRIGCEVRIGEPGQGGADGRSDGEVGGNQGWYHLDGNQIAAILCYALMLDPQGPRRKGLVIETLVTTKLIGRIVAARGESDLIDDLLVGFKYVADVLKRLGRDGHYRQVRRRPQELVLAAEESHGVIFLPHILDKDATPACMYLAGLYQRLRGEGRTLLDYYVSILSELGGYDTVNRSVMMAGAAGMERKDRIMAWLRQSPPAALAGQPVRRIVDHWDEKAFGPLVSESERLPRNVVQLETDRLVVTVRPSGTEPKLKFYCQLLPAPDTAAGGRPPPGRELLNALRLEADASARAIYNDLLAPLGVQLGEVGLLLTDLIELDRKREFESETLPRLRQKLAGGELARSEELTAWLRQETRALLPGADALPALRAPLALAVSRWARELPDSPGLQALLKWTGAAAPAGGRT
jgi:phosphoglucomutase